MLITKRIYNTVVEWVVEEVENMTLERNSVIILNLVGAHSMVCGVLRLIDIFWWL